MVHAVLEAQFPRLQGTVYTLTSPETPEYNCIAWAAGDTSRWWWPTPLLYYWPPGVPLTATLEAFIQAFGTLGYLPCDSAVLETGFEKIALYADSAGTPTHAARQLSDGLWTSKLGQYVDISHELLSLTHSAYGAVAQILKRPIVTSHASPSA